ncbi:EAL domain-containing protein [Alteromonas gracilis]|uniref:two-component system response regulator n=1 Tax=Alteromonas gracilis TaxID=1479524 RepID=UPI003736E90E
MSSINNSDALILAVDDEEIQLEVIKSALHTHYQVLTSTSPQQALVLAEKHTPDIVLLDIDMPDINGFDLCKLLQKIPTLLSASFVFITSHHDPELEAKALELGAVDFITKPIHANVCLMRIKNQMVIRQQAESVKSALHQTHAEKTQLKAILRSIDDGVIATDTSKKVTFINPVAQRLTGFLASEATGKAITDILKLNYSENKSTLLDPLDIAMSQKRVITMSLDVELWGRKGKRYQIELTASPLFDIENINLIGGVLTFQNISDMVSMANQMTHLVNHDHLTGLPNRVCLNSRLKHEISRARHTNHLVAVLMFDIDNFKYLNDTIGHEKGDEVIRSVAKRLQMVCDDSAVISRIGGDEFVVLLIDCASHDQIDKIATKISREVSKPFSVLEERYRLTLSMGISIYPTDSLSADDLIRHADAAMFKVKSEGRNGHVFYDETLTDELKERVNIEKLLHQRLDENALIIHYQPKYSLTSGNIVGVEALVRLIGYEGQLIPPDKFISVAEKSNLIRLLGEQVLVKSCLQVKKWLESDVVMRVAINIGASQFNAPGFADLIARTLQEYKVPPHLLELEITESALIQNVVNANKTILALQSLGVTIALDDFGTGYSSLSYLRSFNFDLLKIDKAFIRDICGNKQAFSILTAIKTMAKSLNLRLVCEGIETMQQQKMLEALKCEQGQGYLFCRPLPSEELEAKFPEVFGS